MSFVPNIINNPISFHNKGCFNMMKRTRTQEVPEMDANSRKERETHTGKVQNRKLPSGMHSKGEGI